MSLMQIWCSEIFGRVLAYETSFCFISWICDNLRSFVFFVVESNSWRQFKFWECVFFVFYRLFQLLGWYVKANTCHKCKSVRLVFLLLLQSKWLIRSSFSWTFLVIKNAPSIIVFIISIFFLVLLLLSLVTCELHCSRTEFLIYTEKVHRHFCFFTIGCCSLVFFVACSHFMLEPLRCLTGVR